jgi:hypothetical protein
MNIFLLHHITFVCTRTEISVAVSGAAFLYWSFVFIPAAPQRPRVEYNTSQVLPGHNVTGQAGERATVKCVSRYGNPPAKLKWLLGKSVIPT